MKMATLLEVKNLVKTYSGRKVLEVPGLDFQPGEICAVCGPNGSGKSTLLRILALLDYPDAGEISLGGKVLASHGDWFEARKRITMVDQNPYAFHGSVFFNVAYGPRLRGEKGHMVEENIKKSISLVGLAGLERQRAATLSGGELQRMAIARAMVIEPEVLILDEPTAHVDAAKVRVIEDLVLGLREDKGTTIIMATHGEDQACRLADRVLNIDHGMIHKDGGRIVPAAIFRDDQGLKIEVGEPWEGEEEAEIIAIEGSGDSVLIRLSGGGPRVRVSRADLERARPLPGEKVRICPR